MKNIHNSFRLFSFCFLFFIAPCFVNAQVPDPDLFERQLFLQGNDTLPCRILSPLHFSAGKKYPLIVFLHGSGERGNDNEEQLTWGDSLFLDSANREKFPAIVVFPQCPADSSWSVRAKNKPADSSGTYQFPMNVAPTRPLA
jgi:poly(3-hydroxybutyrate) depolymerase